LYRAVQEGGAALVGIGCDVENVVRFRDILYNKAFLSNVFTDNEIRYCMNKEKPELYLARKFTAKEAVFKALSLLNENVPLKSIEVSEGRKINSDVRIKYKSESRRYRIFVSISNANEIVFASSLAEKYRR